MNKNFKKILLIIAILFLISLIFRTIDVHQINNHKKPIFCIDRSGGSIEYYMGFGYNIEGAQDDTDHRLYAFSWFDCLIGNSRY